MVGIIIAVVLAIAAVMGYFLVVRALETQEEWVNDSYQKERIM